MRPTPRRVLAVLAFAFLGLVARAHPPAEMLKAANDFLAALSPEQKQQATYALTDAERENWNFVPIARHGLPLKQMTEAQRPLALALLRSGMSEAAMARAQAIMSMELVLKELEHDKPAGRRDPVNYFVTIFGTPSDRQSWGWRFEGHHLSFNFTVLDGTQVFFAPSFIGSNPAEVRAGPRTGERPLGPEDDLGRALMKSLDPAQQQVALIDAKAPGEIVTSNRKRVDPLKPVGIAGRALNPAQRARLLELVKLYVDRFRPEIADATYAPISAAADQLTFAWAGGLERGQGNYYRIQGPTFLIEFDNTQNNANHIHTVYRDFNGDFGEDLLKKHYLQEHAK